MLLGDFKILTSNFSNFYLAIKGSLLIPHDKIFLYHYFVSDCIANNHLCFKAFIYHFIISSNIDYGQKLLLGKIYGDGMKKRK